jgi:hypothetical protein
MEVELVSLRGVDSLGMDEICTVLQNENFNSKIVRY